MGTEVAVVTGERLARYGFPEGHPFGVDRHEAFAREFEARGLAARVRALQPCEASYEELLAFHTPAYVDFVRERSQSGQGYLDAGDTPAFRGVYEAAATVVGATLRAAEAIMTGAARRGFVPIAGLHHAARDRAAGFCVFNDCGVAIELLRRRHGLARVGYVDIDAHGAAGETGRGPAAGTKLNIPVPAGADDQTFARVWPAVLAHLSRFEPQLIILQCGADSVRGDPITHLSYSPRAHAQAARDLAELADRMGHGRVLALGGGGYNRENIAHTWCGVIESLGAGAENA